MDINKKLRDIEIAKLAFIGASIATIGDGIAALAAGLALEAIEQDLQNESGSRNVQDVESTQRQLDYYISELIKIRNRPII
ncbi:translation initiation factor 2 [Paenibacillus sp. CAU 1782]